MQYFVYFLCAVGFWMLGWSVMLGLAVIDQSGGEQRPFCLLDGDDIPGP